MRFSGETAAGSMPGPRQPPMVEDAPLSGEPPSAGQRAPGAEPGGGILGVLDPPDTCPRRPSRSHSACSSRMNRRRRSPSQRTNSPSAPLLSTRLGSTFTFPCGGPPRCCRRVSMPLLLSRASGTRQRLRVCASLREGMQRGGVSRTFGQLCGTKPFPCLFRVRIAWGPPRHGSPEGLRLAFCLKDLDFPPVPSSTEPFFFSQNRL